MTCFSVSRVNGGSAWACVHALAVDCVQDRQAAVARSAVVQISHAGFTVCIALLAHEVTEVSWDDPAFDALGQTLIVLEEPIFASDVACVAVKWPLVATLARSLACLTPLGLVVLIESERTSCLADCSMQVRPQSFWVTLCALVAVVVVAFLAVWVAFLARVPACVVVRSRRTAFEALVLEDQVQPSESVAAGANGRLVLDTRLARDFTLELD